MTREELPKRYVPEDFEQRLYERWERDGYFTPDATRGGETFSIVIPPPNVTGRLHLGHALDNTLIDILVRWKRMQGANTLWMVGTDHAGIATQMVVERELAKNGESRLELGRDAFVERVWKWKEEHGSAIAQQLRRLGVSADWSRERFTLDEGLSKAVRHVFVRLYEDGLIYRDLAMVNWCPRCRTAISDIEVEHVETNGKLYHIDYPLADGSGHLTVATTRPETMLGDTAVAVHPEDDRYRALIGKMVNLPLTGRQIVIVADDILVDPEFGTGVVKVTPAHDKNDYECGKRHDLPQRKVIDETGIMTTDAGDGFAGLDRYVARKAVLEALATEGLLRRTEDQTHAVAYCGKCDTVIEPMISRQWFVKIAPLAEPALEAVRGGTISIFPPDWVSTYYNWMENIHDWCISRQLWWGHRIPAYYCPCGEVIVTESESIEACPECGSSNLEQETDVLDTWFSSALWPFSTMGWPDKTDDMKAFYPTSVLVTGFDILFFWVARMIMFGLRFTGEAPFRHVYLHGLVRDENGLKMSKSRGNVIDPLEVADEFGADAVRFTLAILSTGRDIPLAKTRMQGYSAFANKIWNATRFSMMHIEGDLKSAHPIVPSTLGVVDRWILSRLNTVTGNVNRSLDGFRFDEAANEVYHFFWHEFCDWYIELAKPVLLEKVGDSEDRDSTRRVLMEVLDQSLRLLHPFMPFITEELWLTLGGAESSIMISDYPRENDTRLDADAVERITILQQIVARVRNLRAERGLPPGEKLGLFITTDDDAMRGFLEAQSPVLTLVARLDSIAVNGEISGEVHRDTVGPLEIAIAIPQKEMPELQLAKIRKQIEQLEREVGNIRDRLEDDGFTGKAPAHVVEQQRQREAEYNSRIETLRKNLTEAS